MLAFPQNHGQLASFPHTIQSLSPAPGPVVIALPRTIVTMRMSQDVVQAAYQLGPKRVATANVAAEVSCCTLLHARGHNLPVTRDCII